MYTCRVYNTVPEDLNHHHETVQSNLKLMPHQTALPLEFYKGVLQSEALQTRIDPTRWRKEELSASNAHGVIIIIRCLRLILCHRGKKTKPWGPSSPEIKVTTQATKSSQQFPPPNHPKRQPKNTTKRIPFRTPRGKNANAPNS